GPPRRLLPARPRGHLGFPGRDALRRPTGGDRARDLPQELRLLAFHRRPRPRGCRGLLRHLRRAAHLRRVRTARARHRADVLRALLLVQGLRPDGDREDVPALGLRPCVPVGDEGARAALAGRAAPRGVLPPRGRGDPHRGLQEQLARSIRSRMGRTALIVLAVALLVGSAAAFTRTERLKLAASPVAKPLFERHLSPPCGCTHATSTLSLLLRRPERLDVSVVDSDGAHVATLADAQDSKAGRVSYQWNGRGDDGQIVPDGLYRLKVRLEHDRRTILIPKTILVDTAPPHLRILEAVRTDAGLAVRYGTNEGVRLHLLLDGKKVAHSAKRTAGIGRITWAPPGIVP